MPSPTDRSNPSPLDADLEVCGTVPPGLSGRLVALDPDGVIHSVLIGDGRASYSGRRLRTETVVHDLVYFGGSTLVFGDDAFAYELGPAGDTLRRVDLAGHRRSLAVPPKQDAATGELHLIADDTNGLQAYVVVSAGALMRRSRPLLDTPERVHDLVISRDHVILVADGFVGVASRNGELRSTWIPTGIEAAHAVHAHDAGDSVIVLALTPLLERWTLHLEAGTIRREVLDPTPRRFATAASTAPTGRRSAYGRRATEPSATTISSTPVTITTASTPGVPGDFVFVTDATPQRDAADGGWLVGFVHHPSGDGTELFVIDAADIAVPAIVTVPIPRLVPPAAPLHLDRLDSALTPTAITTNEGAPTMNTIHHTEPAIEPVPAIVNDDQPAVVDGQPRREPIWRVVGGSIAAGFLGAVVLTLGIFGGAAEHVISASALLAFAGGWAMLAVLSSRFTSQPQRWARVPAVIMAVAALLLLVAQPDDRALDNAGWVWPSAALVLAVWMGIQIHRHLSGRVRWLIYPVVASLAIGAVGGMYETVAGRPGSERLPGTRHALRRRRSPPAPALHRNRQPHRRTRAGTRRNLGRLDPHHERTGSHHPRLRLRPSRPGLERRRRNATRRAGHRSRPPHTAHTCERTGPLRARRPLRRRTVRDDLRRHIPHMRSPAWCCSTR